MKEKIKFKGQLKRFVRWPLLLTIFLVILNLGVYMIDIRAGVFVSIGVVLYLLLSAIVINHFRPHIYSELIGFASEYSHVQNKIINDLVIPYALLDNEGRFAWMNQAFADLIHHSKEYKKGIDTIFPEIPYENLPEDDQEKSIDVSYEERSFRAVMHRIDISRDMKSAEIREIVEACGYMTAVYLLDVTELNEYIRKNEEEKLVVGMAYLDNYDEALESVEEVRRSLLLALIDRKINKYFSGIDGLVKKIEKDKYFLILNQKSLDLLKEQKFNILEEVKTVNIGNDMSVTLSIGLGLNAVGNIQNYEQCRIAIEMALGRGGDQVVIKDGDQISYYGGKSQQIEKTTRVKARVKAQALKEFMSNKDKVVVMGHKITDVDAFGAAIGIYRAAKTLGKRVHVVINDPTTSIRPLMAGFVGSPDYEPDMFISSSEAKDTVDNHTAVIVVDTNKPSYTECEELLYMTKTIVVLDHHRRGSEVIQNAVLSYIEPYASSTCEMVAEILQYFLDGVRLRNIEADSIYAGIMIDTNNFTAKTGVRTFEAAAFLRRCGADVTRVRKMLRDDMEAYKARAEAISNVEIFRGCYAIAICPSKGLESPTVVAAQAANELLNIVGVKASFVLTDFNKVVYISARAIDEVNVQIIMERLNGGGHMNSAGAQVSGYTAIETVTMLKGIINEMTKEGEI